MIRAILILSLSLSSAPAAAETIAVTGGRVITMGQAGEISDATVVIENGKIIAVGVDVPIPVDAKIVDATGRIVTPGLVAAGTAIGLIEVREVSSTDDRRTTASDLSAGMDVSFGLNPDSLLVPVARLGGITRAISTPSYKDDGDRQLLFAGQAAAVALSGPMLMRRGVAMVLDMGEAGAERAGGARGAEFAALRQIFAEVRDFALRRSAYDRGETRAYSLSRADMEALVPVIRGQMPLLVTVNRASDIREVLGMARAERVKIILESASEGWRVAPEIAAANVPVLITPIENTPAAFEQIGATLSNASRLAASGVVIGIQGNGAHREREMRYNAGNAVTHGLPHQIALAAITINPARIFGIADQVGSIEVGKEGDVVVWDGDPLDVLSRPTAVVIRGQMQPMTSRQTELRDRYIKLNAAKNGEKP